MKRYSYCIGLTVLLFSILTSAQDLYPFDSAVQAAQFARLTRELRCVVCQNQSLADSNAPLADDLRAKIYTMVKEGRSDQKIKAYFVDRYGEFVLYSPPVRGETWLLWFLPSVLLCIGFVVIIRIIRKSAMP